MNKASASLIASFMTNAGIVDDFDEIFLDYVCMKGKKKALQWAKEIDDLCDTINPLLSKQEQIKPTFHKEAVEMIKEV